MELFNKSIFLFGAVFIASITQADDLKPFVSDGCSAFPDGTSEHKKLWLQCCVAHDYAYWAGGSYQQRVTADQQLKDCVQQLGEPAIAQLMLVGVRVGGAPYFPTEFRWGYGWPYPRFYGLLSATELEQVKQYPAF